MASISRRTGQPAAAHAFALALALSFAVAHAFGPSNCFITPVWPESAVQVFPNVTYGQAIDKPTGKTIVLTLDAYFPPANDTRKARPLAVLVHGGSFESGNSQSDGEPLLARKSLTP